MTIKFIVNYSVRGEDKEVTYENIPEHVSSDQIKLAVYLKQKLASLEGVEEEEIFIDSVDAFVKS